MLEENYLLPPLGCKCSFQHIGKCPIFPRIPVPERPFKTFLTLADEMENLRLEEIAHKNFVAQLNKDMESFKMSEEYHTHKPKESKPKKFWMVAAHNECNKYRDNYGSENAPPRMKFASEADALAVAEEMAQTNNRSFFVLEATHVCSPKKRVNTKEL